MNDIILTGPPRSGTTLTCHLLNKVENTVALHEPMNLSMFPTPEVGILSVREFFNRMRDSLMKYGVAYSKTSKGVVPANPFGELSGGKRASIVNKGLVKFNKVLTVDFNLIIKHNGHFTFLLSELEKLYRTFAVIRNPVATIASWNTIDAPVSQGNLTVLQYLDPGIFNTLNSITNIIERQVELLHHIYSCYLKTNSTVYLKYEEIIQSKGSNLKAISKNASSLNEELFNKNKNPLYDNEMIEDIKKHLLRRNGAYLEFYTNETISNY